MKVKCGRLLQMNNASCLGKGTRPISAACQPVMECDVHKAWLAKHCPFCVRRAPATCGGLCTAAFCLEAIQFCSKRYGEPSVKGSMAWTWALFCPRRRSLTWRMGFQVTVVSRARPQWQPGGRPLPSEAARSACALPTEPQQKPRARRLRARPPAGEAPWSVTPRLGHAYVSPVASSPGINSL